MTLKYPFVTEKAMVLLENQSKLQFLVSRDSTKHTVKRDIEKAFGQNVKSVRTIMNTHGEKKAIVSSRTTRPPRKSSSRLGIM